MSAAAVVGFVLPVVGLGTACGARSELDLPWSHGGGGAVPEDAGIDQDAPIDAPEDVPEDVPPDVPPECDSPDTTYIYVVTSELELLAFKPQSNGFESRGHLSCPASPGATPFSMAVDRTGVAYVVYNDGELFRVSTADAACEETLFVAKEPDDGFAQFGMGFAADQDGLGETLHVADINYTTVSKGLARIATETFELTYIGPFSQNPGNVLELTPTGMGPLWGYFFNEPGPGGTLVQINTETAAIEDAIPVTVGNNSSALAVAWWGGFFYIFTNNSSGGTSVTRFDPETQATSVVANTGLQVVGAGVSTCAPMTQ
ncbi:MAG: hypothetical protein DRI90_05070 [Deltaproteobacteria bacterium]|nr:MAG: hypothetical protein DRI90_05070 [Deltaproteobacteria bacterium]